jgi:hypothetical protein
VVEENFTITTHYIFLVVNQKPSVNKLIYLVHFLTMSCNDQVVTSGWTYFLLVLCVRDDKNLTSHPHESVLNPHMENNNG